MDIVQVLSDVSFAHPNVHWKIMLYKAPTMNLPNKQKHVLSKTLRHDMTKQWGSLKKPRALLTGLKKNYQKCSKMSWTRFSRLENANSVWMKLHWSLKSLTEVDYIDILIQSEKTEKRDGYLECMEALEELKKAAKLLNVQSSMPPRQFISDWWTKFRQQPG